MGRISTWQSRARWLATRIGQIGGAALLVSVAACSSPPPQTHQGTRSGGSGGGNVATATPSPTPRPRSGKVITLLVGSGVVAYDPVYHYQLWAYPNTPSGVSVSPSGVAPGVAPVMVGDMVYVLDQSLGSATPTAVTALDAATGAVRWRATLPALPTGAVALSSLAATSATVVVYLTVSIFTPQSPAPGSNPATPPPPPTITSQNKLLAYSATTGAPAWNTPLAASLANVRIAGVGSSIYLESTAGLMALKDSSGAVLWTRADVSDLPIGDPTTGSLVSNKTCSNVDTGVETLFLLVGFIGFALTFCLTALNPATGGERWGRLAGYTECVLLAVCQGSNQSWVSGPGGMYLLDDLDIRSERQEKTQTLYALNPSTGGVNWSYTSSDLASDKSTLVGADSAAVYYINGSKTLTAVSITTQHVLWTTPLSTTYNSSQFQETAGVIALDDANTAVVINASTGAMEWSAPAA